MNSILIQSTCTFVGKYLQKTKHYYYTTQTLKEKICFLRIRHKFFLGQESGRPVHSTSWKYSTSWKFSLHFVYIFRTDWNFLIKLCSSDPSFNRNILRSLNLKFKISAHAQITITHQYVLITNLLTWYEFETYIEDTF